MPGLNVSVRSGRRSTAVGPSAHFRTFVRDAEKAIERGTRDARPAADAEIRRRLPKRGGFADYMVGRLEIHRSKIPGGMRLTFDAKGTDAARINAGRLRAPLYGNREHWYTHTVRPGFADAAMQQVKAKVDAELDRLSGR